MPKPPGVRRIVCFGDSITFGYGVADEETYAFLLGRTLAPRGVEAVNAGVTGYTSSQVLRLLKRLSPGLGADVATFCIGWNDGTRRHAEDRDVERRLRVSMAVDSALDRLYLFRAMKSLYLGSVRSGPAGPPTHLRVPLDQYRSNLAGMVEECRSRGIRPVFVALPHRRKAGEPVADSPYPKALAQTARELDVPLLGASPLLGEASPAGNEAYFIDSLHFSPAGHERMASELARQLAGLGVF
jgi:lysophospholipase L1-like esterase